MAETETIDAEMVGFRQVCRALAGNCEAKQVRSSSSESCARHEAKLVSSSFRYLDGERPVTFEKLRLNCESD